MILKVKIFIFIFIVLIPLYILIDKSVLEDGKYKLKGLISSNNKVLCMVLTKNSNVASCAIPVWNSWGKKCDKTLFAMDSRRIAKELSQPYNKKRSMFKSIKDYETAKQIPILGLTMNESYEKMAVKVFEIVKLVYKQYGNDYRFFLMTDDDTFVFVDNLRKFISNKNYTEPLTYGYNFKTTVPGGFHSGGGGILFTHESLKRISESIEKGVCNPPEKGPGDVFLGNCSYISNVTMGDSLDELGRERFHPLQLHHHYDGDLPQWLFDMASNPVQKGENCCSEETISFHYEFGNMMKYANAVKYDSRLRNISQLRKIISM